jgi:hypothetical protein
MSLPKCGTPEARFLGRPYVLHFYYLAQALGEDVEIMDAHIERHTNGRFTAYEITYTAADGCQVTLPLIKVNSSSLARRIKNRWPKAVVTRHLNCQCHPGTQQLWPLAA